jgi:hypothetical protein
MRIDRPPSPKPYDIPFLGLRVEVAAGGVPAARELRPAPGMVVTPFGNLATDARAASLIPWALEGLGRMGHATGGLVRSTGGLVRSTGGLVRSTDGLVSAAARLAASHERLMDNFEALAQAISRQNEEKRLVTAGAAAPATALAITRPAPPPP